MSINSDSGKAKAQIMAVLMVAVIPGVIATGVFQKNRSTAIVE